MSRPRINEIKPSGDEGMFEALIGLKNHDECISADLCSKRTKRFSKSLYIR